MAFYGGIGVCLENKDRCCALSNTKTRTGTARIPVLEEKGSLKCIVDWKFWLISGTRKILFGRYNARYLVPDSVGIIAWVYSVLCVIGGLSVF